MISYALYDFEFDLDMFSSEIKRVTKKYSNAFVADLMGVNKSTLTNWTNGSRANTGFPYPNMTNFLVFCNEFDLDPRKFFRLKDRA